MTWNKIYGQQQVKKILRKSISEDKIAHAYCFWGPEGVGKEGLAIEFARVLNCYSPVISSDSVECCESCPACRMTTSLTHPNIQLVFSLPTPKSSDSKSGSELSGFSDDQIDEIRFQIETKANNFYNKISFPGANQIKISAVREVKKKLSLSANMKGRRFIIVCRADEMTTESANAFLKTLEEPHDNITIILTTSRKENILPTILSRCQLIHCPALPDNLISEILKENHSLSYEDASIVAAFSQGSYSVAVEFIGENIKEMRTLVVDGLRTSLKKGSNGASLMKIVDEISSTKDKKVLDTYLNLLIFWLRDAVTLSMKSDFEKLINTDNREIISKFVVNFGDKDINLSINEVEKAFTRLKRNVPPQLVFTSMFLGIRKILL